MLNYENVDVHITSINQYCIHAFPRKNLSELDDMQRYFNHKLSTPTFPSRSEQGRLSSRLEEHRDSETDSRQLLLKSSRLVGEVNSLVSGELLSPQVPLHFKWHHVAVALWEVSTCCSTLV